MRPRIWLLLSLLFPREVTASPTAIQTFTLRDYLDHQWVDEIVHFRFSYRANLSPQSLTLADSGGTPIPSQFESVHFGNGRVTGNAWTVTNLSAKGSAVFQLQSGDSPSSQLRLSFDGQYYSLSNEHIKLRLPRLVGPLPEPVDLTTLPAPLLSVANAETGTWLGSGIWINRGQSLRVKEATSTILESGPIRIIVRYAIVLTDGRHYQADISLGDRQDCAQVAEDSDIDAPEAVIRYSLQPGLNANRTYWRNNYYADMTKGLSPAPITSNSEQLLFSLRPWAFWWLKDISTWSGFYREGLEPFVGVLMMRPSHWTPNGWGGFERTQIPVTFRPATGLDLTFSLAAAATKKNSGASDVVALHREWAITVGTVIAHSTANETQAKLRLQLVKYAEFPLDEVKDYNFEFSDPTPKQKHPFLLLKEQDLERIHHQATTNPQVKAEVRKATQYITNAGADTLLAETGQQDSGWKKFYDKNYRGSGLYDAVPKAYLGTLLPKYGAMLAAGVKGMAREAIQVFMEAPIRPSIGDYGPWYTAYWTRLLLAYDLIAGTHFINAQETSDVESVLVFGAHFLSHRDYWDTAKGMASANPNMTSSIRLPLGLFALSLKGHPDAKRWLEISEEELKSELDHWISPGGAWIECPGYQAASLDGIFLLAQAMKNVKKHNYFRDPRLKSALEYFGYLITPPDLRFPPGKAANSTSPMVMPSIGDMFSGFVTPFNGWMARMTSDSDPAFSEREQFYWRAQSSNYENSGRASAYLLAVTDPALRASPPAVLSRAFPGFGSILRSSWTDPKASYVAHRSGHNYHHYHQDFNEIVYHAKGVPLCVDFGNYAQPLRRDEPYYHNTVSFDLASSQRHWGLSGNSEPEAFDLRSLQNTLDYSMGRSHGGGEQSNDRHLLLLKSLDPLGANYVVIRDVTHDGQPGQEFFWNLWCLSKTPEIVGNAIHFPGQFDVDLDVLALAPRRVDAITDHWEYNEEIYTWGRYHEEQDGVHLRKLGSTEDFLVVLYPRAHGQDPAQAALLNDGSAVRVNHMEGEDVVLLSPGKPTTVSITKTRLSGEVAFARRYSNGEIRLAVVKGSAASASLDAWQLDSDGPVAISIRSTTAEGESSGASHVVHIHLPDNWRNTTATLDGRTLAPVQQGNGLAISLPSGYHSFTIRRK